FHAVAFPIEPRLSGSLMLRCGGYARGDPVFGMRARLLFLSRRRLRRREPGQKSLSNITRSTRRASRLHDRGDGFLTAHGAQHRRHADRGRARRAHAAILCRIAGSSRQNEGWGHSAGVWVVLDGSEVLAGTETGSFLPN